MTTTNDPLVGSTYDGRYRIERRIGAGGMANVYLAEDETLGRRVAIKVLHGRYAEDSQFVERFLREASAAARLNHPNIVQVYDRGQADATYYIAMEYVDGMTLKDLVRRRSGLTEQEVLAYGRQALQALRSAHRNGIVHRDVKPHNMMVDTDGRLKIADFGIARAAADADAGLTEAGSIVGTAQYLSPEQAQGHEVAAPSDLYSLGVVMFEMTTGRVPFEGESPVNVALRHVRDVPPRPSELVPSISPALESIILKAMSKDPADRYGSADEMLADLDLARDGSVTQAMTQVLPLAAAAPVVDRVGATRVTPIVPAPVPARAYETPVPPEPAYAPWEDEEDEPRRSVWAWLLPLLVVLALLGVAAAFLLGGSGDPVPNVVGDTIAEARADVAAAGFTVGEVSVAPSDEYAKNLVVEQTPEGGDDLEKGGAIDLVVSSGPATVDVPSVVGDPQAQAVAALRSAGFPAPKIALAFDDEVEKGRVIKQAPGGGEAVAPTTVVTLTVSRGVEQRGVPDVVGQTEEEARATLGGEDYEFDVDTRQADSSRPAGTVIEQDPAAGAPLDKGGSVTLTLASGSNEVPDVTGRGVDEAGNALREAGFQVEIVEEQTEDPAQQGVVLGTDPGAGQRREVGSTVQLRVGRASSGDEEQDGAEPANGNGNGNRTRGRRGR